MKKDHVPSSSSQSGTSGGQSTGMGGGTMPMDMMKTFSSMMGNQTKNTASPPKTDTKASSIPDNYNAKKFAKILLNHDRISREIDRKYNNGVPRQ